MAFGNFLKEPLRTRIREAAAQYDAFALNEKIGEISDELTLWAQEKTKGTPFEVMNVVVGNIQYPAVVAQAVANKLAVSQDLETRSTQVEIARKDAERRVVEAEGIAKATHTSSGSPRSTCSTRPSRRRRPWSGAPTTRSCTSRWGPWACPS